MTISMVWILYFVFSLCYAWFLRRICYSNERDKRHGFGIWMKLVKKDEIVNQVEKMNHCRRL